ncbi:hypothetical protein FI667_g3469, partial [Globisporangium splendens]
MHTLNTKAYPPFSVIISPRATCLRRMHEDARVAAAQVEEHVLRAQLQQLHGEHQHAVAAGCERRELGRRGLHVAASASIVTSLSFLHCHVQLDTWTLWYLRGYEVDFAEWKMIRNCPGRYILKHRKSSPLLLDGVHVTQVPTDAFVAAALGVDREAIHVHHLQSERCADAVCVVVFDGPGGNGGGVITYCKREQDGDEDVVYVHTLNTASGLQRKLEGLRIAHVLP